MDNRTTIIDSTILVEEYIHKSDWRINANANTDYTNAGLVNNLAGKPIANYWLDKVYSKEEGDAHRNGDYHIHDLDCLTGYCAGWSLRVLLDEGFNGVRGRVESRAPRHFREALGQMANFLGILQSEWAGAQAFSSFDTYLAPYVFKDQLSFVEVKKALRQFIYNLNVPARWGQSPFTNVTIDWTVPKDLALQAPTCEQQHLFRGLNSRELLSELKNRRKEIENLTDATYGDFYVEMQLINRAFYEILTEGDAVGNPFTFPIPTVNITEDFDWNGPNTDVLFENTAKVGSSYFQNFIGSQYIRDPKTGKLEENPEAYKPGHVRSMCPMTPDTEVIVKSNKGITILPIASIVKNMETKATEYEVWTKNGWCAAKPIKTPATKVYKITTSNGATVKLGANHLQPVFGNLTYHADELKVDMFLPFNKTAIISDKHIISYEQKTSYNSLFIEDKNYHYCSITSIEEVEYTGEFLYCFEVDNEDHLFTLANGLVTHNCRLQLDLRELLKRGGGLFGSAEMTGCYTADTEILTSTGWKYFYQLDGTEKVLTMNENGNPSWEEIEKRHEYYINDNIYKFNRKGITELSVTANHRMISSSRQNNSHFIIERADEVFENKKEYQIPKSNPIESNIDPVTVSIGDKEIPAKVWYKFLGIYLSDGYSRQEETFIAQQINSKQRVEIEDTIASLGYKYTSSDKGLWIGSKSLAKELKKFGKAHDKFVPTELFNYSSSLINEFLDGIRLTDYCNDYFYTVSPAMRDGIQALLLLTGKTSYSRVSKPAGTKTSLNKEGRQIVSNYDLFEICEHKTKNKSFMKENLTIENYNGMVYCVTVPNNTVCVRHNGAINWSGNSIGVVTINMARLGYLYKNNIAQLYTALDKLLEMAKSTLEKKRKFIQEMYNRGLYPYTKRYLTHFNNHFSTIGVNGINEMVRNFTNDKHNITTKEGELFAIEFLEHIRTKMIQFQEETGNLYNLEATPAEGTTYRFAKEDKKRYPDIIQAGFGDNVYYTNSSQLPANYTHDAFKALDLQDNLQCKYTGGTVLHLYMNERLKSAETCKALVKSVISNYKLPYITITPVFSVCPKHGYLNGEHEFCPKCDAEIIQKHSSTCSNDC